MFNWQFVSDSQDWRDLESDGGYGGVWTNMYQVIDRCNRALEYAVNVIPANPAEAALKDQYRGELLGLRAIAHLELLKCYSQTAEYNPTALGVVLQTSYVKNPATYRPARNTQGQVMDQINTDLAAARSLIPTTFTDIARLTRNAIIGEQARAALYAKNWQGVVDRATEVIALQPLTNIANYPAIWTTRTLAASQSTEVIWKLNITSANSSIAVGALWQDANGAQQLAPAIKLINTFNQATDVRFSTFFKTSPRNIIAKYGFIPPAGETFIYDIKMMRTSELLLARAEAYAELNQFTLSNNDLNTLRTNRITGYVHTPLPDRQTLIDAIYLERYKELCYEGQRYFDLRRRSLPIQRDPADAAGITTSITLLPTDAHYLLPIPAQEILANPNITQNAGY